MHEKERRLGEFCGWKAARRARLISAELMVRVIIPRQSDFLPSLLTKRRKRPFEIGISGQGVRGTKLSVGSPHHQWKILSAKIIYQPLGLFLYIINKLKGCTNKCSVLLYHRYGLTVLTAVDASISLNNSNVMCFFAKLGILISKEFTLCHNTVWVIPQKGQSALPASYGYTTWTYLVIVIKSCLILHITILDENWFKIKQSALLWHFIPASVTATSTSTSIASLPRMLQCKAIY